jgi:hypothetical protein
MKPTLKITLTVILLGLFSNVTGAAPTNNFSVKKNKPVPIEAPLKTLTVGESLEFDVYWMGIHVGFGKLEIPEKTTVRGREAFHVIATAGTNNFLSSIYPLRDEIHSYIDAETFYSLEFRKKLSEGRYHADEQIVYDYDKKMAFYESFKNGGKKEVPIEGPVHDLVSAFYWFRLQEIAVGKSVHTIVNGEEKSFDLEIKILKQEPRELRGQGVIDSVQVEPKTRYRGMLYDRGRAWVYFSSDKRRIPIAITLKTPYGPVTGVLKAPKKTN